MKKRLLAVLLAVCLFASLMPVTALAADTAEAGATTIALPDGCGNLTLSNPIIRVDTETVDTVIGGVSNGGSAASITELREQPVYVIPIGTTITFPDDYSWYVQGYSSVDDETEEALDSYYFDWGGLGDVGSSYTEISAYWLNTTNIINFGNNRGLNLTVACTETTTEDDGSTRTYEYYSEDSIVAAAGVFFRYELPEENPFTDVKSSKDTDWYYNPVLWAAACGITTGITETTFAPDMTCTRAQIVTFLWRAAGCPEPTSDENPFEDVVKTDDTAWYYDAVLWAVENDITTGIDAEHFDPYGDCTRAQVATFIWRYYDEPEIDMDSYFTDVTDTSAYYYDAVQYCAFCGIVEGVGDGLFAPNHTCTRAQVVTMLYRAI